MVEGEAGFQDSGILEKASPKDGKLDKSNPLVQPPKQSFCPQCRSNRLYKDGLRYLSDGGTIQRWLCRDCGYRFSEQRPLQKNQDWQINTASTLLSKRQVCELLTEDSKNLTTEQTRQEIAQREGTAQKSDIKGRIINYTWQLKKQAYAETTIKNYGYLLKSLVDNGANLYDPENVKETIAKQQNWCPGRKNKAVKAYNLFAAIEGISWTPPKYKQPQIFPFIPTEREIDDLIAGTSKPLSAFLQFLKETAARRGEAYNTKWIDLDLTCRTIRITPEKGSNPRIFHISETLATKLGSLPRNSERIFTYTSIYQLEKSFRRQRKRLAQKLANPRLLNIHCHTFRHWKATMEYYRTRDIFHVMQFLGHRKIENTLLYIQLANSIFKDHDDKYVCKIAKTTQEAMQLVELGFDYVTGEYTDGGKLFKKRKSLYLGSSSEGL